MDYLQDDGFEGSSDEHQIFMDVFFGNEKDGTRKECLATKVINLESGYRKPIDTPPSSSNENLKNDDDSNANTKRMKFSGEEASQPLNGESSSRNIDFKGHFVESSIQGVVSSCYHLKQQLWSARENDLGKHNVSMLKISNSKPKTIGSPVSEESSATRVLVTGPPVTVTNKPGDYLDSSVLDSLSEENINDPRPFLFKHISSLFEAAGWVIESRKRNSRHYMESVYRSPEGKPVRELPKAWRLCGQALFSSDKFDFLKLHNVKRWAGLIEFWSDLSKALKSIEKLINQPETTDALAHRWCHLDPFVTIAFIDRKIGALRKGNAVETKGSLLFDKNVNDDAVLCLKKRTGDFSNQATQSNASSQHYDLNQGEQFGELRPVKYHKGGSDGTCVHSEITTRQDNTTSVPSCDEENSRHIVTYDSREENGESLEIQLTENKTMRMEKPKKKSEVNLSTLSKGHMLGLKSHCESRKGKKKDNDLLISAIVKNKNSNPGTKSTTSKMKAYKPKSRRKLKSQNGSRALLPRSVGKGGKRFPNENIFSFEPRTVLAWLIDAGCVALDDLIQYRDSEDDSSLKDGFVTRDGILCRCCSKVFSLSKFKNHAGFNLNRTCSKLFMESGMPFTLCQLQAWSGEYNTRKCSEPIVQDDDEDQNDDTCGLCGDGGELVCCDNCPSTFHQGCLASQEIPEGNWYCSNCTCRICGNLVNDNETSTYAVALKCLQCEHKYHKPCLEEQGITEGTACDAGFCSQSCEKVYSGLQSLVGLTNIVTDDFSWIILRGNHEDRKAPSSQWLAMKAECNSKLAVALSIMEECFVPMVDPKTGIDMIPHALYNYGSNFARLNFQGFYTLVLEKDDVLVTAASIRIHGVTVAEMPLIATCSKYRRQGLCRHLINAIEEMLKSFKVEKLVISAIPQLVETWTNGFGFQLVQDAEKETLKNINLMVFPGTVLLKKTLYTRFT